MLFGTANNGRGDLIGLLTPGIRSRPTTGSDEIIEGISYRWRGRISSWPRKMFVDIALDRYKHSSWAELWDTKIGGVEQMPAGLIAELTQLTCNILAVSAKHRIEDTAYVLDHHCLRANFVGESHSFRKEIPLIIAPKLLSSFREGWAGQSSSQQINPFVGYAAELSQASLNHVPFRAVESQGCAARAVDLQSSFMGKSCLL